ATAIALEQQGVEPARPLTHDLIKNLLDVFGHSLREVRIVDLQEGTFYADLGFDGGTRVSCRPSDGVAVALRLGAPVFVEEPGLTAAGLVMPDEREGEVEKFKAFLESVSPDDFNATGG